MKYIESHQKREMGPKIKLVHNRLVLSLPKIRSLPVLSIGKVTEHWRTHSLLLKV